MRMWCGFKKWWSDTSRQSKARSLSSSSNFLVFDYCDTDLADLLDYLSASHRSLTLPEAKTLGLQILRAVEHLHAHQILHRCYAAHTGI